MTLEPCAAFSFQTQPDVGGPKHLDAATGLLHAGSKGICLDLAEMSFGFLPNFKTKVENLVQMEIGLFSTLHVNDLYLGLSLLLLLVCVCVGGDSLASHLCELAQKITSHIKERPQ